MLINIDSFCFELRCLKDLKVMKKLYTHQKNMV